MNSQNRNPRAGWRPLSMEIPARKRRFPEPGYNLERETFPVTPDDVLNSPRNLASYNIGAKLHEIVDPDTDPDLRYSLSIGKPLVYNSEVSVTEIRIINADGKKSNEFIESQGKHLNPNG